MLVQSCMSMALLLCFNNNNNNGFLYTARVGQIRPFWRSLTSLFSILHFEMTATIVFHIVYPSEQTFFKLLNSHRRFTFKTQNSEASTG